MMTQFARIASVYDVVRAVHAPLWIGGVPIPSNPSSTSPVVVRDHLPGRILEMPDPP